MSFTGGSIKSQQLCSKMQTHLEIEQWLSTMSHMPAVRPIKYMLFWYTVCCSSEHNNNIRTHKQ